MIDYSLILSTNYPNSQWTLNGDNYEGLDWLSDTPKPTKSELDSQWVEVQEFVQTQRQAKIDAKLAAEAKLKALGLSVEDLRALGF
jgi:hypothetical protein